MRLDKRVSRVSVSGAMMIVAVALVTLAVGGAAALAHGSGNSANGADNKDSLVGSWDLFITTQGVEAPQNEAPTVVTIQEIGNKLTGKVTVPNVITTGSGFQTQGTRDLTLDDLRYNGKKLSFKVSDEDNQLIADLDKISNDEFTGTWRSPISGRWKGAKSDFSGTLKLARKKETK